MPGHSNRQRAALLEPLAGCEQACGMAAPKAIAVYCSSSSDARADLLSLADEVGNAIAVRGWSLVYGGASIGLMGRLADSALSGGAPGTGVITQGLVGYEIAHDGLTTLEVVPTLHERKRRFMELSDAFLVLPGGFGTLDELFEAVSWKQLQVHQKPIVLLNHRGFYRRLLEFLSDAVDAGTIRAGHLDAIRVAADVNEAFEALEAGEAWDGPGERWWANSGVQP